MELNDFYGALYAFNGDPGICDSEEEARDLRDAIENCGVMSRIVDADDEEFADACARLNAEPDKVKCVDIYWLPNSWQLYVSYAWNWSI